MAELATDYLEGELRWYRRLPAWLHLRACAACRGYFDQMRRTVALLRRLPALPVPESLVDDVARNATRPPRA